MVLSSRLVTTFVQRKTSNCPVATRSMYRPEDRRQDVDTVFFAKRQKNTKVSHDLLTLKKDLHAGFYRASDRRDDESLKDSFDQIFNAVNTRGEDTAAAFFANTNSSTNRVGSSTDSNGAGDGTTYSDLALSVLSPVAVAAPGAETTCAERVLNNQPESKVAELEDMASKAALGFSVQSEHLPGASAEPIVNSNVIWTRQPKQESQEASQQKAELASARADNPTALYRRAVDLFRSAEDEEKKNTAYDSPSQSESVLEASTSRSISPRLQEHQQAREGISTGISISAVKDLNCKRPTQAVLGTKIKPLSAKSERVKRSEASTSQGMATSNKSTPVEKKKYKLSPNVIAARERARVAKARAEAETQAELQNSQHAVVEDPSVLSNRGGFCAPTSTFVNGASSIIFLAIFSVVVFLEQMLNRKKVITKPKW